MINVSFLFGIIILIFENDNDLMEEYYKIIYIIVIKPNFHARTGFKKYNIYIYLKLITINSLIYIMLL